MSGGPTDGTNEGIFSGLRVVDASSGMAGPLVSMMLADHGADVVKIEPAHGDWARARPGFLFWNRGKRSVVADLHDEADRARVRSVVASADVVVTGDAEALLQRLGTSLDEHPRLITCSISGFGDVAGHESVKAYEGAVAAATGRMTDLDQLSGGQPGVKYDQPAYTAAPIASFGASQLAVQGVVAALLQRERTGRGQAVATSLLHGAVAFVMRQELGRADGDEQPVTISAATHRGIELCFLTAECSDGRYIQMCARQDQHFRNWLQAVGLGDALDEPRYAKAPMGIPTVADVDELEARLRERMATKTQAEWMRVFVEEFDVGADPFLTPAEFLDHADMIANERVVDIVDRDHGVVRQLGPLVRMESTPAVIATSAPRLGEHDDDAEWRGAPTPLPSPSEATGSPGVAPLDGIEILEVAYYIAGPLAAAILAEMGARVVKVEPLEGDPYRRTGLQSAKFLHGKESLTLDLKQPAGRDVLEQLIDRADVVVHSFRASAAARLGLDAAAVLQRNPRAVHLYAASYGSRGPQRDRAAFHSTPNALTGGGIKQAGVGNPPVNDSYADPGSALGAATAILFGLWARQRTGRGQSMETTMLVSTGYIHSGDMVVYDGARAWQIADHHQRGLSSRYRLYRGGDGAFLFLSAVQQREWLALGALTELRLDELDDAAAGIALESAFSSAPVTEWVERLQAAGVGATLVYSGGFDDWLEDNGLLTPMEHPGFGPYWRLPAKIAFSASSPTLRPACIAGEHSRALLAELGRDADAIDALVAAGVTTTPTR